MRAWVAQVHDVDLYVSALTLGEIRKGLELLRSRDPTQAEVFGTWLDELHRKFGDRILPIDVPAAEEWGRLNAAAPKNTVDSLIAATARVHGLTVVTRNTDDFAGCGVPLVDPWNHDSETTG